MKAIVFDRYGPPAILRCEELEAPTPAAGEVLVRVVAAGANPLDWRLLRGRPLPIRIATGLVRPARARVGADLCGRVEATGAGVTRFHAGDDVYGAIGSRPGSFAELVCARESALAPKPAGLSFEEAAAVPVAALTALQAVRDAARVREGDRVLVNGASGGVGTFAVQIAKAFGAHVTAVCSGANDALMRSIGADRVIDYTSQDFTRERGAFDVILDCMANRGLGECRRALSPRGCYVVVGGPDGLWLGPLLPFAKAALLSGFVAQRLVPLISRESGRDLEVMSALLESGKVRPVIDRRYTLAEAAQALAYLERGHARGKVVIVVAAPGTARS